jgi:hypothetical protein
MLRGGLLWRRRRRWIRNSDRGEEALRRGVKDRRRIKSVACAHMCRQDCQPKHLHATDLACTQSAAANTNTSSLETLETQSDLFGARWRGYQMDLTKLS